MLVCYFYLKCYTEDFEIMTFFIPSPFTFTQPAGTLISPNFLLLFLECVWMEEF